MTKSSAYLADLNPFSAMTKEQVTKGDRRLMEDMIKQIADTRHEQTKAKVRKPRKELT